MKTKQLQRKIMRGVYYAYVLRLLTLPGVWQGFAMLGSMIVLTHFVSLGNVVQNFTQTQVGNVPTFAYNALRTTEVWTFLLIGLIVFSALSIRFRIVARREDSYHLASV